MTMYINPLAQHLGTLQHLNHPVDNIGGLMATDVRKRGHLIGVGSYGPQIYGGGFVGVDGGGIQQQQQPARVGVGGAGVQKIGGSKGGGFRRKRKPRKKKKSPAVAKSSLKKLKAQKKKCDKELKNISMGKMSVKQLRSILKKK